MDENIKARVYTLRQNILDIVMAGKCGHIGGDMSVIDIIAAIYERMNISPENAKDPDRDRFILSKGHCVEALYAVLCSKGFLSLEEILKTYSKLGSKYIGHPSNSLCGIEINSGALGHGLPVAIGMALAGRMDGRSYRVYTVMGDGELDEGSVWEGVMAAAHYKLDSLCAVVDRNCLQISGSTETVMSHANLDKRFEAFGWNVINVENGNNVEQLNAALEAAQRAKGAPTVIIAHTVKGCGSSIMENKVEWHHKVPTQEEYRQITLELAARKERLENE